MLRVAATVLGEGPGQSIYRGQAVASVFPGISQFVIHFCLAIVERVGYEDDHRAGAEEQECKAVRGPLALIAT